MTTKQMRREKLTIIGKIPNLKIGDKVKLRGDMGGFKMKVTKIWNDWYCECSFWGTKRHINMLFLEVL